LSVDLEAPIELNGEEFNLGHYRNMSGTTICTSPTAVSPQEITPSMSPELGGQDLVQANDSIGSVKSEQNATTKNRKEVTSFCDIIEKCKSSNVRARFVLEDDKLWHDKPTMMASHGHIHEAISLADALDRGMHISAKSKHILYVLVAYSLLYFPWDSHRLTKDQIYFLGKNDIDFAKPYTELDLTVDADFKKSEDMCQMYNNEETMRAAIMLLEIALGKPIEFFREPSDLTDGQVNINTDYFAACRVLKSKEDEFFADFGNSVQACLNANFGTSSNSLENEDFRNEIYNRVIYPLEQQLSLGFKTKLKDIGMTQKVQEPIYVDVPTATAAATSSISLLSQKTLVEQRKIQSIEIPKQGIKLATQRRVVQFSS
jgi:hypothetical protein